MLMKIPRRARWAGAAAVLAGIAFGAWRLLASPAPADLDYRIEAVARGDLVVTVAATGNLQPTNQVDVGSELSGTIDEVFVDDNDTVTRGQVLARLDIRRLQDQVTQSRASLAAARARVMEAQASAGEARANLARMERVAELSGGKVPSPADLDAARATLKRTEAATVSAEATVSQLQAALKVNETNVELATIRSPIDGIVLSRLIEPGQTVAAMMQAPVLFKLAENLAQMQLEVDVDEADVGQVAIGQEATFNVDAYAGRQYPSRIVRVGFGAQETDGVVSYRTVLTVDNSDLSLRPGMTATAEIVTRRRPAVLLVPNSALRFTPPVAPAAQASRGFVGTLLPRPAPPPVRQQQADAGDARTVWVLDNGAPVARPVTIGVSDGIRTEVTGGDLRAGDAVIIEALDRAP